MPILKLNSILVPIDFSKISQKALDYAVPLAKQFGAKITLLHAIEPPPYSIDLTYRPNGRRVPNWAHEERTGRVREEDD